MFISLFMVNCAKNISKSLCKIGKSVINPIHPSGMKLHRLESDVVELSKGCILKPKKLEEEVKSCTRFIDYKKPRGRYVKNFGYADTRFKEKLKPEILPICKFPQKTLHISNFSYPHGTIAIPTQLNETISTNGLLQCAGVAVVDRAQNLQTLIHCCPGVEAKSNRAILEYILSVSKNSNPKITIVPGCYKETDKTVSFLVDNIKDILKGRGTIKFANLANPDSDYIVLKNGVLSCANPSLPVKTSEVNPLGRIIYT